MSGSRVLGEKLRCLRQQAGLTQEQLASQADCSDRLIRKAESGGSLRWSTIESIVLSLSQCGIEVSPTDLVSGNREIVQSFLYAWDLYGPKMLDHWEQLSQGARMFIAGDDRVIPFAGLWRGAARWRQCWEIFFANFHRTPRSIIPIFLEAPGQVAVKYVDHWSPIVKLGAELEMPPVWINWHFKLSDGTICFSELQFDTALVQQFTQQTRQSSRMAT